MTKLTDEEWKKVMDQTQGHKIARAFHELYEALAPEYSYQTRKASAVPWDSVPEKNKNLMIRVVAELFDNEVIDGGNALPNLYQETGDSKSELERGGLRLHPDYYAAGSND